MYVNALFWGPIRIPFFGSFCVEACVENFPDHWKNMLARLKRPLKKQKCLHIVFGWTTWTWFWRRAGECTHAPPVACPQGASVICYKIWIVSSGLVSDARFCVFGCAQSFVARIKRWVCVSHKFTSNLAAFCFGVHCLTRLHRGQLGSIWPCPDIIRVYRVGFVLAHLKRFGVRMIGGGWKFRLKSFVGLGIVRHLLAPEGGLLQPTRFSKNAILCATLPIPRYDIVADRVDFF